MAQDQNVVLLIDANASLNDEAGIHCGGSEATKVNVAGTALKELVAERALCIPQTFSKFGPTWRNRRLDFIAVPLDWHAARHQSGTARVTYHRAVTITVTLRREKCQNRERRLNFERAAILTPEAKAQFESKWAQAPTPPATSAPQLIEQAMTMLAQETRHAVCPLCKTCTHVSYQQISILTLNFNTSFVGHLTNVATLEYFTLTVFFSVFVERFSRVWLGCVECYTWLAVLTRTHVFLVTVCFSPGSRGNSRVLGIVAVWSTAVEIC